MTGELARRAAAELVGTLLVVFVGVGAFVAAAAAAHGMLAYPAIGFIALAFAIAVTGAVYTVGPLSGGHLNPAITIALAAVRRFPAREVVPYVAAQLIGGAIGGLLIIAAFGRGATADHLTGATLLGPHVSDLQGLVAEAVAAAFVMFAVMALAIDQRAPTGWAGLIVGLAVGGEILTIGPLTGGSVNPARTTAPYLMDAIFGSGAPWHEYFVYWVGPCVGATVAALTYRLLPPGDAPGRDPDHEES